MRQSTILVCTAAAALLLAANNSSAGTLTPSGPPSFAPAGVVSNNTIALQQTSPSVTKILGGATITPGAGASTVTLTLTGTFTASANDLASYFYNFNIALNSATPATFNLSLTANVTSPFPVSFSKSTGAQAIAANSNQNYTGTGATSATPFAGSGNFTGQLTFNFAAGTTATDKLILTIPGNSIDFAVQATAIPEPSTYALFGVGLLGIGAWSRRRAAAV